MASLKNKTLKNFYCAFCRSPRKIKTQRHIGFFEIGLCLLGSLCIVLFFYQSFDFKFFPLFCVFMVICEVIIQLGHRLSMACPHCGFDPVVYKVSPEKAAMVVKEYMEKRRRDPLVIFTKNPKPNLPTRPAQMDYQKTTKDTVRQQRAPARRKPAHIAKNLDVQL